MRVAGICSAVALAYGYGCFVGLREGRKAGFEHGRTSAIQWMMENV